jgi:hypothetical protein
VITAIVKQPVVQFAMLKQKIVAGNKADT